MTVGLNNKKSSLRVSLVPKAGLEPAPGVSQTGF